MAELRLQNTQLKRELKTIQQLVDTQKKEIGDYKVKYLTQQQQTSSLRTSLDKSLKDQKSLTTKLLKSETDKKKREKLEMLKKHIEDTMR